MADRNVRLITKRTSVPGKIPTGTTGSETNFISQGELASNLVDKKLFSYDGSNVFEFGVNSFLGLTGGTITGNLKVTGNLSGSVLYSGSTNLYDIFVTAAGASDVTRVQPGSNITTGGTGNFPVINLVASPSVNNITFSGTAIGGTVQAGAGTFTSLSGTNISATTYYGNGINLTGVVHGFTGTTSLDFGCPISGESSCAVTAVTNSNINAFSNVIIRFVSSTDHESVAESMLELITLNQSDIIDGVGFNINAYACEGSWGIYNVIYRIVN